VVGAHEYLSAPARERVRSYEPPMAAGRRAAADPEIRAEDNEPVNGDGLQAVRLEDVIGVIAIGEPERHRRWWEEGGRRRRRAEEREKRSDGKRVGRRRKEVGRGRWRGEGRKVGGHARRGRGWGG